MKVYKYQNTNNFVGGGLSEFSLFDYYDSPRIVRYFDYYQKRLIDNSKFEMPVNPQINDYLPAYLNQYSLKSEYFEITMRPSKPFYFDTNWNDKYSLTKRQDTSLKCEFLNCTFRREDLLRSSVYPSVFVYLTIPYEFIQENLTSHTEGSDLRKVYKTLENVDLNDLTQILKAFDLGDKEFSSVQEGEEPFHEWRFGIDPSKITSTSNFGYGYPIMNSSENVLFNEGSHRLAISPLVKRDCPLLQVMPKGYVRGKDRSFFIATPPLFHKDQIAIFEIDVDRKNVGGWFVHKGVIDFGYSEGYKLITEETVKESLILKRIKSLTYDFKFVY